MKMPLAMPSTPPSALAPKAAINNHKASILPPELLTITRSPGQASDEADEVAAIVEFFVIYRPMPFSK